MADATLSPEPSAARPTVADLAPFPRWVAWRTEPRRGGEKPTKVPYSPRGHRAGSNNPADWGRRAEAEAAFRRIGATEHGPGGVGLMLGSGCDGLALGGVDLDACRDPASGALAPWAEEVLARLATYAEVSPSGTGAKLFFGFDPGALPALRAAMGAAPGEAKNGRKWARSGADHGPAIELYLGGRFFAVTDERLPDAPAGLRKVPTDELLWLIREAGPRFKGADPDGAGDGRDYADAGGDDPLVARLYDAAGSDPALARRWAGDTGGLADGSRSGLAFALGAALKRAGFGFDEMRALLRRNPHTREWAAEKGEASGGRELRRIWDRADAGTLAADPEVLAAPDIGVVRLHRRAPPALPLDVFGPWSGWVAAAARGAACPPDYVAAPLLSSASALIGNARWAQAASDWTEPPHLWCASVGDSGDGKSPGADPLFKAVVPELERRMGADFPERLREHRLAAEAAEARREQWKKDVRAAQATGHAAPLPPADLEPQDEPQSPRLRQNDVTIEKVAALLAHAAPKGLLMVRDELAGFLLGMTAYNDGARPFWLEAYGGRPYRVERQKHPDPIDVPHLAVAWWGGVQPERLARLMREADDGLLARFCWFWPDPVPFDLARATHDARWATEALDRLRLLEMAPGQEPGGPARPVTVPLAEAARPRLVAFGREMQRRQQTAGGLMRSAYGKARGLALRLSLVLEFLWWCGGADGMAPPPREISVAAFLAAARLVAEYLMPMAERVYGDAAAPEADRNAATLARWIARERPAEVHVRRMQRHVRLQDLRTAEAIHAACKALVEAGWLLAPGGETGFQQRPRAAYPVNPNLWKVLP